MKYTYASFALLILSFLAFPVNGQLDTSLSINNINASFTANGGLFQDQHDFGKFTINNAGNKAAIFAASLWISGYQNDTLHTAVQDYHLLNDTSGFMANLTDFSAGPVANDYTAGSYTTKYNRVWHLSQQDIDQHISTFNQPGYTPPPSIANWPGNGDTANGEAPKLAPFYDADANELYEPTEGDYPVIRGDEAVYAIFNDINRTSARTASEPLGVEIHLMAYAYDTASARALHNSIFLNYRIINRSSDPIDSLVVSNWMDPDLGNYIDDLIGADSTNNLVYSYNADANDEGPLGFGSYPPAVGLVNLSQKATGHMYYNNAGGWTGPQAMTEPQNPLEYFHYMTQRWKNGNPVIVENPSGSGNVNNGDGYVASGTGKTTNWAYDENHNWFEATDSKADKRHLMNSGLEILAPGNSTCLDFAFVYARDSTSQNILSSVDSVKSYTQQVQDYFSQNHAGCIEHMISLDETSIPAPYSVYPNPTSGKFTLRTDASVNHFEVKIFTLTGELVVHREFNHSGEVDLNINAPAGVYLLKVVADDFEPSVTKIIKR